MPLGYIRILYFIHSMSIHGLVKYIENIDFYIHTAAKKTSDGLHFTGLIKAI